MNRILIYTPIYPPKRGGASSYFSNLTENLDEDYEIIILTKVEGEKEYISKNDSIPIYRIIPNVGYLPLWLRTAIPSLVALIASIYLTLKNNVDIVHAHSTSRAVPGLAVSTSILRVPLIYDCRDEDFPKWFMKLGNAKHWLSCSGNIDRRLVESGVEEHKITRVPVTNPPYISEMEMKRTPDKFNIVFVGSISEFKGVFLIIEAFESLCSQYDDVELVLLGDGPDSPKLVKEISRSEYQDRIQYLGRQSHRETLSSISQADVLVLPSEREGLPRVVMEALELGTPVIATPVGDIPELINDGQTGLLINRESEEIKKALNQLYSNPELRSEIRTNGTNLIENRDWQTVITRIQKVYSNI